MGINILQVVPHYLPSRSFGGVLQSAHSLSMAVLRKNCEIHVCTTNMDSHKNNFFCLESNNIIKDGVTIKYSHVPEKFLLRRWGFSTDLILNIWNDVNWADVVLLNFHYQFATWIGALICRLRKKPYIVFTHGSLNRMAIDSSGKNKKLNYIRFLEKQNFQNALFMAYQSQEELESSIRFGRSIVIPNGIAPQTFESMPKPGLLFDIYPQLSQKFIFLFLGRLDPNKGLDVLLPAFAKVRKQAPKAHLLLAGPDERGYQKKVEDMVGQLGLQSAVTFSGYIFGDQKLAALQDSHAFVLPSRYEGMSMALLEALYCKLPVITTPNVGLWQRLQVDKCALISTMDVDNLAEQMLYILYHPTESREMAQRGHQLIAEHYNWDAIAESLLEKISNALPQLNT